jgi:hypothetical protein
MWSHYRARRAFDLLLDRGFPRFAESADYLQQGAKELARQRGISLTNPPLPGGRLTSPMTGNSACDNLSVIKTEGRFEPPARVGHVGKPPAIGDFADSPVALQWGLPALAGNAPGVLLE